MTNAILEPLPLRRLKPRHTPPIRIANVFGNEICRINVAFEHDVSIDQIVKTVAQLQNPQLVLWYIGYYGLREAGVQFYRDSLISPILKKGDDATFWLVDLTAWGAFKDPRSSIRNFNSVCMVLEDVADKQIKCIKSSKIFEKMQNISEETVINYFKKALKRAFISKASGDFPESSIRTGDLFANACRIISDWYNHDTSKSYSILQYLEACLLIEEIFSNQIAKTKKIDLVFILPNDELKYYEDKNNSFQKDLKFLIEKYCLIHNIKDACLHIRFLSFRYGSKIGDRPYNARGKILKKNALSYEDVIGNLNPVKEPKERHCQVFNI